MGDLNLPTNLKWYSVDDKLPEPYKEVLVYESIGHSGFSVKHYVPYKPNYSHGWYPGGGQTAGTFWAELD